MNNAMPPEPERVCSLCGESKPMTAFHLVGPGKRRAQCGKCRAITRGNRKGERKTPQRKTEEQKARWREAVTPEVRRRYTLAVYGITPAQYEVMLTAQDGGCAICGGPPRVKPHLVVDHCHASGVVRALLCSPCNRILGSYEAFRERCEKYLAQYGEGNPLLDSDRTQ